MTTVYLSEEYHVHHLHFPLPSTRPSPDPPTVCETSISVTEYHVHHLVTRLVTVGLGLGCGPSPLPSPMKMTLTHHQ